MGLGRLSVINSIPHFSFLVRSRIPSPTTKNNHPNISVLTREISTPCILFLSLLYYDLMETEIAQDGSRCVRCGLRHVTPTEVREEKDRLGASWGSIGWMTGYSRNYSRNISKGRHAISCRWNKVFREFLVRYVEAPLVYKDIPDRRTMVSTSQAILDNRNTDYWLRASLIAFEIRFFVCKGCGKMYIGRSNQSWCREKKCRRIRRREEKLALLSNTRRKALKTASSSSAEAKP